MVWKQMLAQRVTKIDELATCLKLTREELKELKEVTRIHPFRITRHVVDMIDPEDPDDPIRKMYIPSIDELDFSGSYDTSGEALNTRITGLQHKYGPTALLLVTNRCAIYCRYCFRKRLMKLSKDEILSRFRGAVSYIRAHEEINNVLLSGGDPLMLPTSVLRKFLEQLQDINHLHFIRFGTKIITSLPQRILEDDELIDLLKKYNRHKKRIYMVTHINHPREIEKETKEAVQRLLGAGIATSCQTVLLRGVNDDPDTIVDLMNGLVSIGIAPYYVFQCRPVKGVRNNFQTTIIDGIRILDEARKSLSGIAKRFKYVMSHPLGKIEILGTLGEEIIFKVHEAKYVEQTGIMFTLPIEEVDGWLPEFLELPLEQDVTPENIA
ncbi:MAG: KamA family radical SAM protein [Spirochaetales bacterium]|nr:KamA family radical SAM protein [Spirochaetales bacterium]